MSTYITGRNGVGKSMRSDFGTGYDVGQYQMWSHSLAVAEQHNTIIHGHWHSPQAAVAPAYYNVCATNHVSIRWSSDGSLSVVGPLGTVIHTTAAGIWPQGSGKFFEMKLFVNDTTGYIIVKLEGTTVISLANIDTQVGGSDLVTSVTISGMSYEYTGQFTVIDDIYLLNGAGTTNNDFLGDCNVAGILPSGNGTHSDWVGSDGNSTDNYALVDEGFLGVLQSDYVAAYTIGATDTYTFADLSGAIALGVKVAAAALRTDSVEIKQLALVARDAGGTEVESSQVPIQTTRTIVSKVWDKQPDGSDWDLAAANGAEFGIRVKA
jgi:hypothetical protein